MSASKSQVVSSTALVQAKVTVSASGSCAVAVYSNSAPTWVVCAGIASIVGGVPGSAASSVATLAVAEFVLVPKTASVRARK